MHHYLNSRFARRRQRHAATVVRALLQGALVGTLLLLFPVARLAGQDVRRAFPVGDDSVLSSLVQRALATSPALLAAERREAAARARAVSAGVMPDPMLMAGLVNVPIKNPSVSSEPMTMAMIGVGQTIPYPGKLSLRREVASREVDAETAAREVARLEVERSVKDHFYEIAYLDRAFEYVRQNRETLADVARVAEARYGAGAGGQQDLLTARVELTRVAEQASALLEQRRARVALLNAALDRPTDTPLEVATVPQHIVRAAVRTDAREVRFAASTLGARASGSPFRPLEELQSLALERNPALRQHLALVEAQAARVRLTRRDFKPDLDVSLQYGQRTGREDMFSLQLSMPLRLHKRDREEQELAGAQAALAAMQADHRVQENDLRAEVARLESEAERSRTQLALYVASILPQGRAALDVALAGYRTGEGSLAIVLDAQSTLFAYQTIQARALSDFAQSVAALARVVGSTIFREVAP
ncbi:MAG: TolC family protein [Gemmatimonadaceae bacterium]